MNLVPNQTRGFNQQLADGVRGFMLDIHQTSDGAIPCHNSCTLVGRRVALWVDIQLVDFAGEAGPEGASTAHDDELLAVARAHDATPAQIRLAWTLHQGPHVLAIPGTGNPDHLVENIAAGALRLTTEEAARLGAVHRAKPSGA